MSEYLIFNIEANLACMIIFGIMLVRDWSSADKQERQIKYDHVLLSFIFYFISDFLWAAVLDGLIPKVRVSVVLTNFANFILMSLLTYMWLRYVMAVEHVPNRDRFIKKIAVLFPFVVSTLALIITYFAAPSILIGEDLELKIGYTIFLAAVPIIYIVAVLIYALRKAVRATSVFAKKKHYYIGFFPFILLTAGLFQMLVLPRIPVFCFASTIIMLIFYIQSMERQISIDPLTGLNNRGQLMRYISQDSNIKREGTKTFAVMLDVNDFKLINDSFGHAEGDSALKIVADSLGKVIKGCSFPVFLGRYGGDEFVIIAHPKEEAELDEMIRKIREEISEACEKNRTPYVLSIGAGYDEYLGGQDSMPKCMQRADYKLYLDKEYCKIQMRSGKPV